MKLKIKVIGANETHVMIQIVEQEGFEQYKTYRFNGAAFDSDISPEFDESSIDGLNLYVRGCDKSKDEQIIHIPHEHWSQVFTAIEQLNAFVEPVKHTIVIDGKTVEISEESFNALKESLINER